MSMYLIALSYKKQVFKNKLLKKNTWTKVPSEDNNMAALCHVKEERNAILGSEDGIITDGSQEWASVCGYYRTKSSLIFPGRNTSIFILQSLEIF